jgi:hypothetical protein
MVPLAVATSSTFVSPGPSGASVGGASIELPKRFG